MNTQAPHARVPVVIARNAAISPQARCLFLILASYAGPDGSCWPSRRTLAVDLGFSVRTVATLLGELERNGILRRQPRLGTSTIFHLKFPQLIVGNLAGEVMGCTGADEPGLTGAAACTGCPDSGLENTCEPAKSGSTLHGGWEADCTGTAEITHTREADCTGQGDQMHGGWEADCTGGGSTLHGGGKQPSYRTNPLNYTTYPIPDTEAEPGAAVLSSAETDSPSHDPPDSDPWSTRNRFDPSTRWPAFDQVRAYALRSGVPEPEALSIWESYTSTGWVDRHGNPIRHWGAAVTAAWRYREENRNRQAHGTGIANHSHTQSTHGSNGYSRTRIGERLPTRGEFDQREDPRITDALALLKARWQRENAARATTPTT